MNETKINVVSDFDSMVDLLAGILDELEDNRPEDEFLIVRHNAEVFLESMDRSIKRLEHKR